jgi:hypothetical protein
MFYIKILGVCLNSSVAYTYLPKYLLERKWLEQNAVE